MYNLTFSLSTPDGYTPVKDSYLKYGPYLYVGFMPSNFAFNGSTQGYTANGVDIKYTHCSTDHASMMVLFANAGNNEWSSLQPTSDLGNGILQHYSWVPPKHGTGSPFRYSVYSWQFGGCGLELFSYVAESVTSLFFGLPFDFTMP